MSVYRIYVEKKPGCDEAAKKILWEINNFLGIKEVKKLRVLNRYDAEGAEDFEKFARLVLSEPQVDRTFREIPPADRVFGVEFLPGQFDRRAAGAAECAELISTAQTRPLVASALIYLLYGKISDGDLAKIKNYFINPVEAREADLAAKTTLISDCELPGKVALVEDFDKLDLAMDAEDLKFCKAYFGARKPTITEIKVLDAYWSDHCRHTTFTTELENFEFRDERVKKSFERYLKLRELLNIEKPITLMDMATIGAKYLKRKGILKNLDESDEINACSVKIKVDANGRDEDWLLLFKNETHNHPTEIEPFGGAATCLGGAIRDPLANRGYVFQAMRVTGAANPLEPLDETLAGKLPQRRITTGAAAGYSSYGNQIGLAAGLIDEIYHPGYVAKRLETGFVLGAVPIANVRREKPAPGDAIILLGGRTGRDGIGGAAGSSKAHKIESSENCAAEVQKGAPPEERKLQRLFRNPEATRLIKKCNDFGAGGVCVAIGELADGLEIDLDRVPKKYEGLDGTELAVSESQERMAIATDAADEFIKLAETENLEATVVGRVTAEPRLVMTWRGEKILDIERDFLNTNGAPKKANVVINAPKTINYPDMELKELVNDLNFCSKKGLIEMFDSTVGAATVLAPMGGKFQLTPPQVMAAKIPLELGETNTVAGAAYGFNPYLMEADQYGGAYRSVFESVCKLVAAGFSRKKIYLSFQEYFEKMTEPESWGKPASALLGALDASLCLGCAAIGGKDSMSGTFENLNVPPTLISFAVGVAKADDIISPEFKTAGNFVCYTQSIDTAEKLIAEKKAISAYAVGFGGVKEAIFKMCIGNKLGFSGAFEEKEEKEVEKEEKKEKKEEEKREGFILECERQTETVLGRVSEKFLFNEIDLAEVLKIYENKLEEIFPFQSPTSNEKPPKIFSPKTPPKYYGAKISEPSAAIPVFPGTNCEYDTARAAICAGIIPKTVLIRNIRPEFIRESVMELKNAIDASQIIIIPGGFAGADEPEGAAKFITAVFRSQYVKESVENLLERGGLILGICNGFQALLKLGLIQFGRYAEASENSPTLTFNSIGRYQSYLARTKISSRLSPWFSKCDPNEIYTIPIAHGEGRFVAPDNVAEELAAAGQLAAQYVNLEGEPTRDVRFNPNNSIFAAEAVSSPDGRVLGKMGHSERAGKDLYKNVPGNKFQPVFESGADYFRL